MSALPVNLFSPHIHNNSSPPPPTHTHTRILHRTSVNLLMDGRDPTSSRPFVERFNRRFSNSPRSYLEYLRDMPMLVRMMWREIAARPWQSIRLLRISLMILPGLGYLLSPFDVIPDILPIVGMIDDVMVLLIVFVWISHLYRRHVLRRQQQQQ